MTEKIKLRECLYGMETQRPHFRDEEAMRNALLGVVSLYRECHTGGRTMGPLDVQAIEMDAVTGEVSEPVIVPMDKAKEKIYTMKFLPPEILAKDAGGWDEAADRFVLAQIMFCIWFGNHPYDGKMVAEKPLISTLDAHRIYDHPVFVFDTENRVNALTGPIGGSTVKCWEQEDKSVKEMFERAFIKGAEDPSVRPAVSEWEALLAPAEEKRIFVLRTEDAELPLKDGTKICLSAVMQGLPQEQDELFCSVLNEAGESVLRNDSEDTFSIMMPDKRLKMLLPGEIITIEEGMILVIGPVLGKVI